MPRVLWRDACTRQAVTPRYGQLIGFQTEASLGARQRLVGKAERTERSDLIEEASKEVGPVGSADLKKASGRSAMPIFWGDSWKESDRKPDENRSDHRVTSNPIFELTDELKKVYQP